MQYLDMVEPWYTQNLDMMLWCTQDPYKDQYARFLHVKADLGMAMYVYIREYGSTLYVGLARAVSPTNTNFRLTFLLTRLQEALYEDLAV